MSELRLDPLRESWVIVAEERGRRVQAAASAEVCPFCEGNEEQTVPEVYAHRRRGSAPNTPGWRVRVVPNLYPAVRSEGESTPSRHGLRTAMRAVGRHEVIIESPQHVESWSDLDDEDVVGVLDTWAERLRSAADDPRLASAFVFKNAGRRAGASLEHAHSQLIALPVVPRRLVEEMLIARRRFEELDECATCALMREESEIGLRIVHADETALALCPHASRLAYETWIVPTRHASDFAATSSEERREIAGVLRAVLHAHERVLGGIPYNVVLRSAPLRSPPLGELHWRLEVLPRLAYTAGFEWASGIYIDSVSPEHAAEALRAELTG